MIVGIDLLDEELVYSGGARFQALMDYPNRELAVLELFGTPHALATADLPVHLGHLASSLLPGHPYTVDRLIDRHTLYPLYAAVLPQDRAATVRAAMVSDTPKSPHVYTGMFRSSVRAPIWFRYCPTCVDRDRARYGETYWHRIHQVPGVFVCPDHRVFLEESSARARTPARLHEFVPAEDAVASGKPRPVDVRDHINARLARIASDVAWILRHGADFPEASKLQRRYFDQLADRGYVTYGAQRLASFEPLLRDFESFYTPALLEQLQCAVKTESSRTWLHRLLDTPAIAKHPLMHLLLIQFLGHTAESFCARPDQVEPFGEDPFPCLNRAADHFGKLHAELIAWHAKGTKLTATFRCPPCGFTYTRGGPDPDGAHKWTIGSVQAYGPVWEAKLLALFEELDGAFNPIADALGCNRATVAKHARRLLGGDHADHVVGEADGAVAKRERYRSAVITLLAQVPNASRKELRQRAGYAMTWLAEHDCEWLDSMLPMRLVARRSSYQADDYWCQRDDELAALVMMTATAIRTASGKPRRVSVSSLARDLAEFRALHFQRAKLPKTQSALDRVTESEEDFAIRRVAWAADQFRAAGFCPTYSQLLVRAGLRQHVGLGLRPRVRAAAEAAITTLPQRPIVLKGRWATARSNAPKHIALELQS